MQRDPKDAGEAQEKFPFLVPSVMSRRILKKQELTSLQAAWIRKLVPRLTAHVKQILVLGDTQPPCSSPSEDWCRPQQEMVQ